MDNLMKEQKEEAYRMYYAGYTTGEIARELNVAEYEIVKLLVHE